MSTSKISRRNVIKTLAALSCSYLPGATLVKRTTIRPLISNPKNVIILRGDDGHLYVIPLNKMKTFRMPLKYENRLKKHIVFRRRTTTITKEIMLKTGILSFGEAAISRVTHVQGLR